MEASYNKPSRLSAKVSAGRGDEFGGSYILRIHKCAFKSGAAWHCQLCTVTGNIIVEMASGLGLCYCRPMLGGRGDSLDKTREFSEIEL